MIKQLRVGIPVIGGKGWLGGASHMELHIKAIATLAKEDRPQLFLVVTEETLDSFSLYHSFATLFDGLIFMGTNSSAASAVIDLPLIHCVDWDELFTKIDFFFPVSFNILPGRPAASWIHDFQHKYLPDFFSAQDIALRDELCRRIADQARLIFCSSKAVEADFRRFYPSSTAITKVLALRVSPEEAWLSGAPDEVQQKYSLPNRFILCSNQFWIHKNHRLLFEAISLLRNSGQDIHLVCTGLTSDFRCPSYLTDLEQYIEELGVSDLVHILGQIPRFDQIQLIRRSLFVVQPSLFEGLSLIVQECRSLGKPIILSDLDVHLEHQYGVYFNRSSAADLAAKITALEKVSQPGPDVCRETQAKFEAVGLTTAYARDFCKMVEESQDLFLEKPSKPVLYTPHHSRVLLTTSLIADAIDITNQHRAVASWLDGGFTVVSLNRPADIPLLQPDFPQVRFVPVANDSHVSFDDLVTYLDQTDFTVCGIVDPDTCLYGNHLADHIAKEAINCLIYQEKKHVESLQVFDGTIFLNMGCLFFDKRLTACYPRETIKLCSPWWDYWAILLPIVCKVPVKRITTPFAYHVVHSERYDLYEMLAFAEILAKYAPPPFPLSTETLLKYQHILLQVIRNHSLDIALPGLQTLSPLQHPHFYK